MTPISLLLTTANLVSSSERAPINPLKRKDKDNRETFIDAHTLPTVKYRVTTEHDGLDRCSLGWFFGFCRTISTPTHEHRSLYNSSFYAFDAIASIRVLMDL